MKLGIVVVYMVAEQNGKLLELHLDRIEKHTASPYTIYGSVNRLLPKFRERLQEHPRVQTHEFPPIDATSHYEHSYYLQKLVDIAIKDDVTHIAIFHVDSFPITDGWDTQCASRLTGHSPVATLEDEFTALLFFSRDFYLARGPEFLVDEDVLASQEFKAFERAHEKYPHSGIGYLFKLFSLGLSWSELRTSGNQIYDDLIFHFRGVARDAITAENSGADNAAKGAIVGALYALRKRLPKRFGWRVMSGALRKPIKDIEKPTKSAELARLLADPEKYLEDLRADV